MVHRGRGGQPVHPRKRGRFGMWLPGCFVSLMKGADAGPGRSGIWECVMDTTRWNAYWSTFSAAQAVKERSRGLSQHISEDSGGDPPEWAESRTRQVEESQMQSDTNKAIKRQVHLPFSKAFEIAVTNIRLRFGRSMVTASEFSWELPSGDSPDSESRCRTR